MLHQKKKNKLGKLGEDIACKYLRKKRYKIVKRNFKTYLGEVDIIAVKNNTLTFFEVKTRKVIKYGNPIEAVNSKKLQRIKNAGVLFAKKENLLNLKMAIEVISIEKDDNKFKIKIYTE